MRLVKETTIHFVPLNFKEILWGHMECPIKFVYCYTSDVIPSRVIVCLIFPYQVLEEIHKQNEVIEIPQPIISIQLVLNVPPTRQSSKRRKVSVMSRSSLGSDARKMVNFADDMQAGSKSDSADEEESGIAEKAT